MSPNVLGIDVSDYQGNVDWKKVKAAGITFAFIKATEGGTIVASTLARNRQDARAAGIICGYYHFFHPRTKVDAQVDNFVSSLGSLNQGDLPPALDLEVPNEWQSLSLAERNRRIKQWLDAVKSKLGADPIIYCSSHFPDNVLGNPAWLKDYPLWVADYHAGAPRVPKPWQIWTLWQYSESGKINGVAGTYVDLDQFNGSLEQLKKFQKP